MDIWNELFGATLTVFGHDILWREVVGNGFGLLSAYAGLRRRVWAWPVGIVGNVLLFTVFMGVWFTTPQEHSLLGQASRQIFFIITAVYGWWRWHQSQQARGADQPAITPRWATGGERTGYLLAATAGIVLVQWVFLQVGIGWDAPRWYYWTDAWIFVGSILATYAMARGWNDFWLVWIAVDLVGVPLLWHGGYYPSAVMFLVYGALVIWGFVVWLQASRVEQPSAPEVRVPSHSG